MAASFTGRVKALFPGFLKCSPEDKPSG